MKLIGMVYIVGMVGMDNIISRICLVGVLFELALRVNGQTAGSTGLMVGDGARTNDATSTAVGVDSAALGQHSTALGNEASSSSHSTALGYEARSSELGTAVGDSSNADVLSTAMGYKSRAIGGNATALGANSEAGLSLPGQRCQIPCSRLQLLH